MEIQLEKKHEKWEMLELLPQKQSPEFISQDREKLNYFHMH